MSYSIIGIFKSIRFTRIGRWY